MLLITCDAFGGFHRIAQWPHVTDYDCGAKQVEFSGDESIIKRISLGENLKRSSCKS